MIPDIPIRTAFTAAARIPGFLIAYRIAPPAAIRLIASGADSIAFAAAVSIASAPSMKILSVIFWIAFVVFDCGVGFGGDLPLGVLSPSPRKVVLMKTLNLVPISRVVLLHV
jgi:hypothetical protein